MFSSVEVVQGGAVAVLQDQDVFAVEALVALQQSKDVGMRAHLASSTEIHRFTIILLHFTFVSPSFLMISEVISPCRTLLSAVSSFMKVRLPRRWKRLIATFLPCSRRHCGRAATAPQVPKGSCWAVAVVSRSARASAS